MSEIRLIECAIISLCSDVFILINFYPHCDKNIFSGVCSYLEYRVVPRETVLFDYWLIHIRVQHLLSGSTTLECDIWSGDELHKTAKLYM